jgi:hypothetical protein
MPSRSCRPGRCNSSNGVSGGRRAGARGRSVGEILVKTGCHHDLGPARRGPVSAVARRFPERPDAVRVSLVTGPLLAAVRQAAIVTSEQSKGVDFVFEPGRLVLSGRSAESGESRIELPIDHAGEAVKIKLDPGS